MHYFTLLKGTLYVGKLLQCVEKGLLSTAQMPRLCKIVHRLMLPYTLLWSSYELNTEHKIIA